jgi:hypothetical protein
MATTSPDSHYVDTVLATYLWVPGTPSKASRQDRRVAHALERQCVPLQAVVGAIVIAVTRRTFRSAEREPLAPVRTLSYFLPVIEEVLDLPPDPGYVDYLRAKLAPLVNNSQVGQKIG